MAGVVPASGLLLKRDPGVPLVYGGFAIALLGGVDVTLKKFYRENGKVRLQPANPAMQPIMVGLNDVEVQGVVVGVMRRY